MTGEEPHCRVAMVGAGAAGTVTTARLLDAAAERGLRVEILLVNPDENAGRGLAYSTPDERHLLNVPAGGMSAVPTDPGHFVRWLDERAGRRTDPGEFVPRHLYGAYLAEHLAERATYQVVRLRDRVVHAARADRGLTLRLASGGTLAVDAAVLATGNHPPGTDWAPAELRGSAAFVADPWAPGALAAVPDDGDVLLVGTGLTMVDVALAVDRPGRTVHAVSRSGLLPATHAETPLPPAAPDDDLTACTHLDSLRAAVLRHVARTRRRHGDWRPAIDGLRPFTAALWQRLSDADRARFLGRDAQLWNTHRHRMPPVSAARLDALRDAGRLTVRAGEVTGVEPVDAAAGDQARSQGTPDTAGGTEPGPRLAVRLSDGRRLTVGAVINCTGPQSDPRRVADPLVGALFATGLAAPGPLWLGLATAPDGRVTSADGQPDLPLWTLGSLRKGGLWESTAMPEIRTQAAEVASAVLDALAPQPPEGRLSPAARIADARAPRTAPAPAHPVTDPAPAGSTADGNVAGAARGPGADAADGAAGPGAARAGAAGGARPGAAGAGAAGARTATARTARPGSAAGAADARTLDGGTDPAGGTERAGGTDPAGGTERAVPRARRVPTDPYGLRLTTSQDAADAYNAGLDRILRVRNGAEERIADAVLADPGFAVGHAALALLGHEWGADVDVPASLAAAVRAAGGGVDERERSFVTAVAARVTGNQEEGGAALLRHVTEHPRDALAVSLAVPTIAFGGVTCGERTWSLVEGLAPAYGNDWWYLGLLAFVRQEQERWDEAESLAVRALAAEPSSGHAVHARTHVFYETGQHAAGLAWLDRWIDTQGPAANNRAHFCWHAALHELMLGDPAAVRARYLAQLAPPTVTGPRALVDSGALLWRCRMTRSWDGPLPADEVVEHAPEAWLTEPPTAFAALHVAVSLAAAEDTEGLGRLRDRAERRDELEFREVVAPLCTALCAVVQGAWGRALSDLGALVPRLAALGGSAAQREVVEETLLFTLTAAGRYRDAAALLDRRLDRRPSPLDAARLTAVRPAVGVHMPAAEAV